MSTTHESLTYAICDGWDRVVGGGIHAMKVSRVSSGGEWKWPFKRWYSPHFQLCLKHQQSRELESGLADQCPFVSDDTSLRSMFITEDDVKFGGPMHYLSFEELKEEYREKEGASRGLENEHDEWDESSP